MDSGLVSQIESDNMARVELRRLLRDVHVKLGKENETEREAVTSLLNEILGDVGRGFSSLNEKVAGLSGLAKLEKRLGEHLVDVGRLLKA